MKARKKPVEIEFVTFTGDWDFGGEMPAWLKEAINKDIEEVGSIDVHPDKKIAIITTLEGAMTAVAGCKIIRGVKGEIYACDPDIFAMTYDIVEK